MDLRCRWRLPVAVAAALIVLAPASRANDAGEAQALLGRMAEAMKTQNYDGTFIYLRGASLDLMRILHSAGPEGEVERLISLNGPPREVIRDKRSVVCIFSDTQSVLVEKSQGEARPLFPSHLGEGGQALGNHYTFSFLSPDRVAGRPARVLYIHPKTPDRYGYRLWVDSQSAMLLKSVVLGEHDHTLEQILFVRLDLPARIPEHLLKPGIGSQGFHWYTKYKAAPLRSPVGKGEVTVGWLPDGFVLRERRVEPREGSGPSRQYVYGDGLAVVSIFIEAQGEESPQGGSEIGAVNTYSTIRDGSQITVVGEVPEETVRRIAESLTLRIPPGAGGAGGEMGAGAARTADRPKAGGESGKSAEHGKAEPTKPDPIKSGGANKAEPPKANAGEPGKGEPGKAAESSPAKDEHESGRSTSEPTKKTDSSAKGEPGKPTEGEAKGTEPSKPTGAAARTKADPEQSTEEGEAGRAVETGVETGKGEAGKPGSPTRATDGEAGKGEAGRSVPDPAKPAAAAKLEGEPSKPRGDPGAPTH